MHRKNDRKHQNQHGFRFVCTSAGTASSLTNAQHTAHALLFLGAGGKSNGRTVERPRGIEQRSFWLAWPSAEGMGMQIGYTGEHVRQES